MAQSNCWESPKPTEFGETGAYWENVGWKVLVKFSPLTRRTRPKDHMEVLRPVLPPRYSPLQANGNGVRSNYLTELTLTFAETLARSVSEQVQAFMRGVAVGAAMPIKDYLDLWEQLMEVRLQTDASLEPTERETIIRGAPGPGPVQGIDILDDTAYH